MSEIENLDNQEKKAINELRIRLKNVLTPDMYEETLVFYRFLKARDFDIDKAESMLRKHITWRKAYQMDNILDFKPLPIFLKYIQGTYLGEDKEGCGVRYSACGQLDIRDIVGCLKLNSYMKHWLWTFESDLARIKEANMKTGRNASKFTYICNMDKLQFWIATHPSSIAYSLRMAHIFQDNYPERLKALFVINAPPFFATAFSIVKGILAAEIVRKLHIYGKDEAGWKEALLKEIDADVLPAFLGGNRTDPDGNPRCNTFTSLFSTTHSAG